MQIHIGGQQISKSWLWWLCHLKSNWNLCKISQLPNCSSSESFMLTMNQNCGPGAGSGVLEFCMSGWRNLTAKTPHHTIMLRKNTWFWPFLQPSNHSVLSHALFFWLLNPWRQFLGRLWSNHSLNTIWWSKISNVHWNWWSFLWEWT